jgi:hypothetical protein
MNLRTFKLQSIKYQIFGNQGKIPPREISADAISGKNMKRGREKGEMSKKKERERKERTESKRVK